MIPAPISATTPTRIRHQRRAARRSTRPTSPEARRPCGRRSPRADGSSSTFAIRSCAPARRAISRPGCRRFSIVRATALRRSRSTTRTICSPPFTYAPIFPSTRGGSQSDSLNGLLEELSVPWVQAVPQFRVADHAALEAALTEVVAKGGEGLILHRAASLYRAGPSDGTRRPSAAG